MLNVRRLVTGHNADGKAVAIIDDVAGNVANPRPGVQTALVWTTDSTPADLTGAEDRGALTVPRSPAYRGSTFRVIEFSPGNQRDMHVTPTIDYAVVMSGEIDMELDDGVEVHLRAGDVLVQRATVHNWANHGDAPCVIAFVLIDAQE